MVAATSVLRASLSTGAGVQAVASKPTSIKLINIKQVNKRTFCFTAAPPHNVKSGVISFCYSHRT
jgi:hypothetical protein